MPEIFVHAGLHKTGSTTLQKWVFPFLEGDFRYLGRPYASGAHFIDQICWSAEQKLGISSETYLGRLVRAYAPEESYLKLQLHGIRRMASVLPQAHIVLGVRPHVPWIESIYKHYLKYGGTLAFHDFFSLDGGGLMKPEEFLIAPRIRMIKELWRDRVFVYDAVDLHKDGLTVAHKLADFTGTVFKGDLNVPRTNIGVNAGQATMLRKLNGLPILKRSNLSGRELRRFSLLTGFYRGGAEPLKLGCRTSRSVAEYFADDWRDVTAALS